MPQRMVKGSDGSGWEAPLLFRECGSEMRSAHNLGG
jgi:hypothetical protein